MTYIKNINTGKIELTGLDRDTYLNLESGLKDKVKRYFSFSRRSMCWVSKASKNTNYVESIAQKIGMIKEEDDSIKLTEEEKKENELERLNSKLEKCVKHKENAEKRVNDYQSDFNENRKDIAYITQPDINSCKGRVFTNQRNNVIARYEKGFEEMRKAEYYENKIKNTEKRIEKVKKSKGKEIVINYKSKKDRYSKAMNYITTLWNSGIISTDRFMNLASYLNVREKREINLILGR